MKQLVIAFAFISVLLIACSENMNVKLDSALQTLNVQNVFANYNSVVIIPFNGCSTCTQTAIEFLKQQITANNKVLFIITNYGSEKEIRIQLKDLKDTGAIIYDKSNVVAANGFHETYPFGFLKDENNTVIMVTSNPSNTELYDRISLLQPEK